MCVFPLSVPPVCVFPPLVTSPVPDPLVSVSVYLVFVLPPVLFVPSFRRPLFVPLRCSVAFPPATLFLFSGFDVFLNSAL